MTLLICKIILASYLVNVAIALAFNWSLKNEGLDGIPWKECFSPIKMLSIIIGFTLYIVIPMHVFEQYVLRFYDDECRNTCLLGNNGKCKSCGCNTLAKMWSPLEKDSRKNWGKIIWSKKKYKILRSKYPVKIKIEF